MVLSGTRIRVTPPKYSYISVELAVETAVRFGISGVDAKTYAKEILGIVRENWEKQAVRCGLTRRLIEEMRPAFRACYE